MVIPSAQVELASNRTLILNLTLIILMQNDPNFSNCIYLPSGPSKTLKNTDTKNKLQ